MLDRFSDRARRAVVLAQEEARQLSHNYIGTEHILLGIIHEGQGVGYRALDSLDITLDAARSAVKEIIGTHTMAPPSGNLPFTPRAKEVLESSERAALQLDQCAVCTEHILLALLGTTDKSNTGNDVISMLGVELALVRRRVMRILRDNSRPKADDAQQRRLEYFDNQLEPLQQQLFKLDEDIQAIRSVRFGLEIMDSMKAMNGSHQFLNIAGMIAETERHLAAIDSERELVQGLYDRTMQLVKQLW